MKQDVKPDYQNQKGRSVHNLSHRLDFTSSTGHILPVFNQFLNAGESIQAKVMMRSRTQPLQTAAFAEIDEQIDWFFVPATLLLSTFGNTRYQVNDWFSSSIEPTSVLDRFPLAYSKPVSNSDFEYVDVNSIPNFENAEFLDNIQSGTRRLLQHLGMNGDIAITKEYTNLNPDLTIFNPKVFPYAALAYQCIYQHYYRSDDFELFNRNSFNLDRYVGTAETTPVSVDPVKYNVPNSQNADIFRLRYVRRGADYFNNIHRSPTLQSINTLFNGTDYSDNSQSPLVQIKDYLLSTNEFVQTGANKRNTNPTSPFTSVGIANSSNLALNSLQVASLRSLFAVDKLLSVTSRGKKTVDDQVLAHFGFRVPTDIKHNIQYLGSDLSQLNIGEVVATSAGNDVAFGEIAGKGNSSKQGKRHQFTAPCDGVLMAVFYARPKLSYTTCFDKVNAVADRTDLFIPEYDHLGMQPLFSYEYMINPTESGMNSAIVGWQWRYEQFKRRFNKAITGFARQQNAENSLSSWIVGGRPYNDYNTSGTPTLSALSMKAAQFFVTPVDLNPIMQVQYSTSSDDGNWIQNPSSMFARDPLLHTFDFEVSLLSKMSTYSMPELD